MKRNCEHANRIRIYFWFLRLEKSKSAEPLVEAILKRASIYPKERATISQTLNRHYKTYEMLQSTKTDVIPNAICQETNSRELKTFPILYRTPEIEGDKQQLWMNELESKTRQQLKTRMMKKEKGWKKMKKTTRIKLHKLRMMMMHHAQTTWLWEKNTDNWRWNSRRTTSY